MTEERSNTSEVASGTVAPEGSTVQSETDTASAVAPEVPEARQERVEVQIKRSVRYGRLMIVGAFIGGVVAVMLTLMNPVEESALYEMRQIAGFMLVVGAAIGLLLGGLLALTLNLFARKKLGSGVAVHTDVQ